MAISNNTVNVKPNPTLDEVNIYSKSDSSSKSSSISSLWDNFKNNINVGLDRLHAKNNPLEITLTTDDETVDINGSDGISKGINLKGNNETANIKKDHTGINCNSINVIGKNATVNLDNTGNNAVIINSDDTTVNSNKSTENDVKLNNKNATINYHSSGIFNVFDCGGHLNINNDGKGKVFVYGSGTATVNNTGTGFVKGISNGIVTQPYNIKDISDFAN